MCIYILYYVYIYIMCIYILSARYSQNIHATGCVAPCAPPPRMPFARSPSCWDVDGPGVLNSSAWHQETIGKQWEYS